MSMGQHGRQICLLGIFAVLACLAAIVSIMKGSVEIPLPEILAALSGERGTHAQILMNNGTLNNLAGGTVNRSAKLYNNAVVNNSGTWSAEDNLILD